MQKYSGSAISFAPWRAASATSLPAASRFSATLGVDTICNQSDAKRSGRGHGSAGSVLAGTLRTSAFVRSTFGSAQVPVTWYSRSAPARWDS